jgi:hypothetical protein
MLHWMNRLDFAVHEVSDLLLVGAEGRGNAVRHPNCFKEKIIATVKFRRMNFQSRVTAVTGHLDEWRLHWSHTYGRASLVRVVHL